MCFFVGGTTLCNVHLKEIPMEEVFILGICNCRTKVGFICIIPEIEVLYLHITIIHCALGFTDVSKKWRRDLSWTRRI